MTRLETPRLILRTPSIGDADALCAAVYGDPAVMRFVGDGAPWDRERVASWLAAMVEVERRRGFTLWTLVRREDGAPIGDCGLVPIRRSGESSHDGPEIEIGYRLARAVWGRGLATEAVGATLAHAFGPLELTQVIAVTHPDNAASRRVLLKAGLRDEGTTRAFYDRALALFAIDRSGE